MLSLDICIKGVRMHKIIKIYAVFLLSVMLLILLSACDNTLKQTEQTTMIETEQPPLSLEIIKEGKSNFVICRPDETTDEIIETGQKLINAIKNTTGAAVEFKSDWLRNDEAMPTERYEILLGNTNRPESIQTIKTLKYNDYFIGIIGNKLVIVGGSDTATSNATDYFINNFLKEQNPQTSDVGNLIINSEENYLYSYNYRIKTLTILDKSIGEYTLVIPQNATISELRFAVEFKEYISRYSGYNLIIQYDNKVNEEYEILIGKTSRTTINVSENEYKINFDGTKFQILAENFSAYDSAYLNIRDMIPSDNDTITLNSANSLAKIDTSNTRIERSGEVRILINNVLGNSDQSLYPIKQRSQMLAELYLEYSPDVIGMQEFSSNSRSSTTGMIKYLTGYTEVTVTVTNSDKINYTPLFYRTDRLRLLDSGYHLFNDGRNDRSKSITWAVFEVKATGERFAVCSTHFFWMSDGNAARLLDAEQLLGVMDTINTKYNCPIFSGGDYNCNPTSEPYKKITAAGCLDIQSIAEKASNYKTSHAYPEYNTALGIYDKYYDITGTSYSASIDHIFLYGNKSLATVKEFKIINDKYALLGSDHTPLIADFNIN